MKKLITQAILTKGMLRYDMKSLGERKLIFIESLKGCVRYFLSNIYFFTKK